MMLGGKGPDAVRFVLDALERATCFVFGDDSPGAHWSGRFYFVRVAPRLPASSEEQRRGTFFHGSVWVIRPTAGDPGAWSRKGWWLAVPKTSDPSDPDEVRWTFADGWAECERILREGIYKPEWQQAKIRAAKAAEQRGGQ